VHLATGNYHPATARLYTDFGLLTSNEDMCADVAEVFKQLTGLGRAGKMKHLWQSPFTLHQWVLQTIEREIETRDSRWFLMRVLPYRTAEDRIDGVVLTFVEMRDRRRLEARRGDRGPAPNTA